MLIARKNKDTGEIEYTGGTGNLNGDVAQKVNKSDVLTLEEIQASTDLTGKVASAEAVNSIKNSLGELAYFRRFAFGMFNQGAKHHFRISGITPKNYSRPFLGICIPYGQLGTTGIFPLVMNDAGLIMTDTSTGVIESGGTIDDFVIVSPKGGHGEVVFLVISGLSISEIVP